MIVKVAKCLVVSLCWLNGHECDLFEAKIEKGPMSEENKAIVVVFDVAEGTIQVEYRLHPVGPIVMLCAPWYAAETAQEVLRRLHWSCRGRREGCPTVAGIRYTSVGFERTYSVDSRAKCI
jgi:hypothetical protein